MIEPLEISALDGFRLSANRFSPDGPAKGVVLLCPGLGIPQHFYFKYCAYLADQGYQTIIFDYRGIGSNDDNSGHVINMRNWGILDISGVLNWIDITYPKLDIYLFGHSVGGQVAGLISNHHLVKRFVFFGSTVGHWTKFDFPMNLLAFFMFHIHIPVTANLLGYMPQSLTYRGVRIAKGVALEWAAISRSKEYISSLFGKTIEKEYYGDITQKIDWITFTDDTIATERAVAQMKEYYINAEISHHRFSPSQMNLGRIGHAGFFSNKGKDKLWEIPIKLIENSTIPITEMTN